MDIRMRVYLIRHYLRRCPDDLYRWLAWRLPKRLVMWAFYRVIAGEPDPDCGMRTMKPVDAIDNWSRHHGLY